MTEVDPNLEIKTVAIEAAVILITLLSFVPLASWAVRFFPPLYNGHLNSIWTIQVVIFDYICVPLVGKVHTTIVGFTDVPCDD